MASVTDVAQWADVIKQSNIFTDAGHSLGWSIIKGLGSILNSCEKLVNDVYKFIDFTEWTTFEKLFNKVDAKWLLVGLFTLSLIGVAWYFMFNHGEQKAKILKNVFTFLLILFVLPSTISVLNSMTKESQHLFDGQGSTASANKIISNGVIDLKHIDKNGFSNYKVDGSTVSGKLGNNSFKENSSNILHIDVNEVIAPEKGIVNDDYMLGKITTDDNGNLNLSQIEEGKLLGIIDYTQYNYRYHISYGYIIITLLASSIAYFFVAFKIVKIMYELAISPIIALVTSAGDMVNGDKTKEAVKNIFYSYAVLMIIPLLMQVYFIAQNFITNELNVSAFVKTFLLVICAVALCDGPNLVQRIFGIDVGLNSGFHTMATMFMASKTAFTGAKGLGNMISGTTGAGVGVTEAISSRISDNKSQNISGKGDEIINTSNDVEQPTANTSQQKQENNIDSNSSQNNQSSEKSTSDVNESISNKENDNASSTSNDNLSPVNAGADIEPPTSLSSDGNSKLDTQASSDATPILASNTIPSELPQTYSINSATPNEGIKSENNNESSANDVGKNATIDGKNVTTVTSINKNDVSKQDKFERSKQLLNNRQPGSFQKGRAMGHKIGFVGKKHNNEKPNEKANEKPKE